MLALKQVKKAGKTKRAASAQGDDLNKEQQQQEALLDQLRTKVVVLQDQLQQLMPQMVRMEQVRSQGHWWAGQGLVMGVTVRCCAAAC